MLPKDESNSGAGYFGYMVANPIDHGGFGMMESDDGIHYRPIKAPDITADFHIPTLEPGGVKKIGNKYYFIGGDGNNFGFSGFGVYTLVSDNPTGPFRPDLPAYRLTGTSGIDGDSFVHILAAFVKDSPEDLVSDPFSFNSTTGTDGRDVWFLPMRRAVVDDQGIFTLATGSRMTLRRERDQERRCAGVGRISAGANRFQPNHKNSIDGGFSFD